MWYSVEEVRLMPRVKTKTATQSKNEYAKRNYDSIRLQVKKGRKEAIRSISAKNGESLQGYINRLIEEDMKKAGHPLEWSAGESTVRILILVSRYVFLKKEENFRETMLRTPATMLCNQKRYCTGKPRYHNGFGVFSCPNFQVQTKRYFSLLRGLELPTPTISGGFWEMYSPESRLFSFPLKNYFLRSSLKSKDDLPACSGKRFALHFRANLT